MSEFRGTRFAILEKETDLKSYVTHLGTYECKIDAFKALLNKEGTAKKLAH